MVAVLTLVDVTFVLGLPHCGWLNRFVVVASMRRRAAFGELLFAER
jgi:hypothetical protein